MREIEADFVRELSESLQDHPHLVQVVLGPRQVGKTTGILQLLKRQKKSCFYHSADDQLHPDANWLLEKWQEATLADPAGLLVIDEIQKVPSWSQTVKRLWDGQSRNKKTGLRLVLLGSSSLEIRDGLSESLAGRFRLIRANHWGYTKSRQLAGLEVEKFIEFGGYPGSYSMLKNAKNWRAYIRDSIVEAVIGKDILNIARVHKPALFRQAFTLLMSYPAQEISLTKLLGQLQDSGNTDLIKHYIELYEGAFLIKALQKYAGRALVARSSSPKLIPLCGALIDRDVFATREGFGRAFEAAVGAALIGSGADVFYWRDGNLEVDYVAKIEGRIFVLEVKSGRKKSSKGMDGFLKNHKSAHPVFITSNNIEAFLTDPRQVLAKITT